MREGQPLPSVPPVKLNAAEPTQPPPKRSLFQRFWSKLPLTNQLAIITTLLLMLSVAVTSISTTLLLENTLQEQVDSQLVDTGATRTVGNQALTLIKNGQANPIPSTYYIYGKWFDGTSGQLVSSSTAEHYGIPNIKGIDFSRKAVASYKPNPFTIESNIDGAKWRAIILPISSADGKEYIGGVLIALPLKDTADAVDHTRLLLGLTGVAMLCLTATVATLFVGHALGPLREIESVAGKIAKGELSARINVTQSSNTEIGSLQRSLNSMLTQNEHAFEARTHSQERMQRFISDASHELRTPLATVRGWGELYQMGGVPPEQTDEVMGRIESEAKRMARLVEDLLQLARMDEGRPLEVTHFNVSQLAREAISDLIVLAPDRDTQVLTLEGEELEEELFIDGDRERLSQVLTNLLSNVLAYSPNGSPVEIAVGTNGTHTIIEVRDHGPGIDPADAKKVFDRFYRTESSRNRNTGGSGLGLAIVATIIKMHRGKVSMLNTPGGGATVRIILPNEYAVVE